MKILISGGLKSQNIVRGLEKKFETSGIDFIVVPFIEDIDNIYQRGEYFDRALIIEQCWNRDFEITDENVARKKINDFANTASLRDNSDVSFVFLTQTQEIAEMVYEEILDIQKESTIIVKAPKYTVSFFSMLVTSDADKFPTDIIYKQKVVDAIEEEISEVIEKEKSVPEYEAKDVDNIEEHVLNNNIFDATTFDEHDKGFELGDLKVENEEEHKTEDEENYDDFEELGVDLDDSGYDLGDLEIEVEEDHVKSGEIPDFSGSLTEEYSEEQDESDNEYVQNDEDTGDLFSDDYYDEPNYGDEDSGGIVDIEDSYDDTPIYVDDEEDYKEKVVEAAKKGSKKIKRSDISDDQIRAMLDAFASRGNSIVVTGCGGCGTSMIAYNLANTIVNLGYTCLLVDMDTDGRAQSYISKDNYDSIDYDNSGLMSGINSSSGIGTHTAVTREGFHLLTIGLGSDVKPIEQMLVKERLSRFVSLARTNYNFVVYDIPFKTATEFAKDITFMADSIALVLDSSNWGTTKTMLGVCNIESDDMQDTIFNRAQLLFNKYRGLNNVLGKKVKSALDITKAIDRQVLELIGEDTGYYFQNMHICGVVNDDIAVEDSWFSRQPYSETPQGRAIFTELLCNIVLKR